METKAIDRKKHRAALKKGPMWGGFSTDIGANKIGAAMMLEKELNPANLLQAAGTNPVRRGREKVNHTLLWLAIFVRSTQAVILERLGIEKRGWMRKLQTDGFVKPVISNVNSGELWVLTQEGLLAAEGVWGKSFDHYPDRPERQSQATLRHDLAVQKIVAGLMASGEATAFQPISRIGGGSQAWRPDAIIKHKDGYWLGIEYERSPKYGEELLIKLNRIILYLNTKNDESSDLNFGVRWYSHHRQCLADYQKMMQAGVPFREYSSVFKKWALDPHSENKNRRMKHARDGVQVVLMDKDLAKYM